MAPPCPLFSRITKVVASSHLVGVRRLRRPLQGNRGTDRQVAAVSVLDPEKLAETRDCIGLSVVLSGTLLLIQLSDYGSVVSVAGSCGNYWNSR